MYIEKSCDKHKKSDSINTLNYDFFKNTSPKGAPVSINSKAEPWIQTEFGNPESETRGILKTNKFNKLKYIPFIISFSLISACPNPTDIINQYPVNYIKVKKNSSPETTVTKSTEVIYTNVNSNLETPVIASNKSGNAVIVWVDDAKGTKDVYARRIDTEGNNIGEAFQVNTTNSNEQHLPAVSMNANGDFIIAWSSKNQDGAGYGIYARKYDKNGGYIGNEFKVNTSTTGDQWIPSVALNNNGGYIIVWQSFGQDGSDYAIVGQKFDKSGAVFGSEFLINNIAKGSQEFPKIVMDTSGNFMVIWLSNQNRDILNPNSKTFYDIYGKKYNRDGTPVGAEFAISTTIGEQGLPALAMNDNNNYVVAWNIREQNTDKYDIYARASINGTLQKTAFKVDTSNRPDITSKPSVAIDSTGNFMIVWNSEVGLIGSSGLYGKKYDNKGNEQEAETKINSSGNNVLQPDVSSNKSGDFFVTWREY